MRKLTITEEQRAEYSRNRALRKAALTLAYQLGMYVGEYIVNGFLPTISVDSIHTSKNISVTCGEGDECRRLNDLWFRKTHTREDSDAEWSALRAYHAMLEDKYLPEMLECHIAPLNVSDADMPEFKRGLGVALWDCDCSHYSTDPDDITVSDDESELYTLITLRKSENDT